MFKLHNIPRTFERRGTTVPLTHPKFPHIRVREYDHGGTRQLEAVLPGYSGVRRGETTVMLWDDLQKIAQFNERDRHVLDGVAATNDVNEIDPIAIRLFCQRAEAQFSPDEAERHRARQQAEQDAVDRETVRLACLAQLTRECGIARGDSLLAKTSMKTLVGLITTADSQADFEVGKLIDRVLHFAAERSNSTVEDVRRWMDPVIGMIAPLGSITDEAADRVDGFLFRQHAELLRFRKSLGDRRPAVSEELQDTIDFILGVCDQGIGYVNGRINDLGGVLGEFAEMFEMIDDSLNTLWQIRRDVAYALDGWTPLIAVWDAAVASDDAPDKQALIREALEHILAFVPIIPAGEFQSTLAGDAIQQERSRLKLVRQMHSWQTNELDVEIETRVANARQVSTGESKWQPSDSLRSNAPRPPFMNSRAEKATPPTPAGT